MTDEKKCGSCCEGKSACRFSSFHFEPILWFLFGGGGTVASFCMPVTILLFGILLPLGIFSGDHLYSNMHSFLGNFLGKIIIFVILSLNMWHACHRIYHSLHDFKIHPPVYAKLITYGIALLATLTVLVLVL